MTADGIDHGKGSLEDCIWAVVERFKDGFLLCPLLETGGKCEECMEILEARIEREDKQ